MAPKLADDLATSSVDIDPEDLAAEMQIAMNTQLSYNNVTPHECVYGALPNTFSAAELSTVSSCQEAILPFYRHQLVRTRSVQAFHEGLLQERFSRALVGRPRTEHVANYRIGQLVDVEKDTLRKSLSGWHGPCVVTAVLPNNHMSVRWQGDTRDYPLRRVRLHIIAPGVVTEVPEAMFTSRVVLESV